MLQRIASNRLRGENPGHSLQTTELVHEAYLRLVDQDRADWQNRAHFFGVAATIMRRILVDHARKRATAKRGDGRRPLSLDEGLIFAPVRGQELIDLHEALEELEAMDPRTGRVIELSFFAGLSLEETAAVLGISARTVKRAWTYGCAWLQAELEKGGASAG